MFPFIPSEPVQQTASQNHTKLILCPLKEVSEQPNGSEGRMKSLKRRKEVVQFAPVGFFRVISEPAKAPAQIGACQLAV